MNRKLLTVMSALTVTATLTSCGSSDTEEDGPRDINIGAVPVVDVAALYVGENQGFFEDRGITLDIEFAQGGSALVPALMNDEYDFIYSNVISAFQAIERDLPIVAVAEGGRSTGVQGEDHGGLLVSGDSDIESPAELEGLTVAVNAVLGLHEIAAREAVKADGGDPDTVEFIELQLPDMETALENGQVDAIATSEPFLGNAMASGSQLIGSQFVDTDPDFITAVYLAGETQVNEDPELVADFTEALQQSFEYAADNPDDVRAELDNFTEIEPETAEAMILTEFGWGLPEETILRIAEVSADAGVIDDPEGTSDALLSYVSEQ